MFKLEITKINNEIEFIYNMNRNEDDFLQFIPKNFGVPKENVKAFIMPDENKDEIEAYLKLGPEYALDLGEEGKIKVITITEQTDPQTQAVEQVVTLVKEYVGTLIQWPYDEKGNFLGNGYELGGV